MLIFKSQSSEYILDKWSNLFVHSKNVILKFGGGKNRISSFWVRFEFLLPCHGRETPEVEVKKKKYRKKSESNEIVVYDCIWDIYKSKKWNK